MGECKRCGAEVVFLHFGPIEESEPGVMRCEHTDARCADRLKTQLDEALARAERAKFRHECPSHYVDFVPPGTSPREPDPCLDHVGEGICPKCGYTYGTASR